jgi:hypothetical protein
MFHDNTQALIDYWQARAEPGRAPCRSTIDPGDLRRLIPQTFIAGRMERGLYPLRLAGGFVGDLHRRDLRGANALGLWSERDRLRLQQALEEIRLRPAPLVVACEALTDGPGLSLEVTFAPLRSHDGGPERYIGLYQPLSLVSRLQGRAALELSARAFHRVGVAQPAESPIRLAALDGRRIA